MTKWATIAFDIDKRRYEYLSDFLRDQGIKNQWEYIEINPTEFLEHIHEIKKDFDQVRIDSPFRHTAFLATKKHEADMLVLRSADCFFQDQRGEWWLRSATYHGMERVLNDLNVPLDKEGAALIVGAGGAARAAISTLVKAGMSKFNITSAFDDQVLDLIRDLEKLYFSVKFNFVSQGQLVLLSGTNSVVVNTTPYTASNEIVKELAYFNFLKSPGVIWELSVDPIETELVTEAEQIGAKVIRGHEIALHTDHKWAEWVWPDQAEYLDFKMFGKELLKHAIFKKESVKQADTEPSEGESKN